MSGKVTCIFSLVRVNDQRAIALQFGARRIDQRDVVTHPDDAWCWVALRHTRGDVPNSEVRSLHTCRATLQFRGEAKLIDSIDGIDLHLDRI